MTRSDQVMAANQSRSDQRGEDHERSETRAELHIGVMEICGHYSTRNISVDLVLSAH